MFRASLCLADLSGMDMGGPCQRRGIWRSNEFFGLLFGCARNLSQSLADIFWHTHADLAGFRSIAQEYVYVYKRFCEVNMQNKMSCFQKVALWIFVLVDRCRKGFRNVSGTFTVILKFCCNAPQFFLGSRLSIKVCAGTFFEALTDNGLLVKIFCSIWHVGGGQSWLWDHSPSLRQLQAYTWTNLIFVCRFPWWFGSGHVAIQQTDNNPGTMQNTPPNIPANEQGKLMYRISFWNWCQCWFWVFLSKS